MNPERGKALVVRIGGLGDVLLTRRLAYSLGLGGFRTTLFVPARHAPPLLADPWIEAVLDSESPRLAEAFDGSWPDEGGFEIAVVISNSADLEKAARGAAAKVIRLSPTPARGDTPISEQWADGARAFCLPATDRLPALPTDAREALVAGATLIHPGSGSPDKNWRIDRFAELGKGLASLGHRVVWILGPADANLASSLSGQIMDCPSLRSLAATLARSRLFIGNDSGVSHLAAAVGAPSLILFGPTDPMVWRPEGPRVRILRAPSAKLTAISVDDVAAASNDMARLRDDGMKAASPSGR